MRGRIDLLDVEGRIVDLKTAARKPSGIPSDYAFQLATYSQITPGASGHARLDTLVKTKTVQLIRESYRIGEADLHATQVLYPLAQSGMQSGLYFPEPAIPSLQPPQLRFLEALRRRLRRGGEGILILHGAGAYGFRSRFGQTDPASLFRRRPCSLKLDL